MPIFRIFFMEITPLVGDIEADTLEEAIDMAEQNTDLLTWSNSTIELDDFTYEWNEFNKGIEFPKTLDSK